ncbi:MAG: hypothetical protein JOZ10_08030 [Acidobacteria bacterium]|nr:hypothetical protein [Acidobacteriota bacterium]MBV9438177.1 hypothetical protein [Acidobacteriota bacterium]
MDSGAKLLQEFFGGLVTQTFSSTIGLTDHDLTSYISAMLAGFCQAEEVYKIRDAAGRSISDVGEMLLESDPVYGPAPSFDREREVRRHIGDYTLFFAGMFPESINHYRLRRQRLENLVDFIRAGKESYYIVSKFDVFEYADAAPLFAKLSERFEDCVCGLNMVKNELDVMQHPIANRTRELLM